MVREGLGIRDWRRPLTDREVLETQIGRPLRAPSEVVARCHLDLPVVATVPPLLDDGTPFPTRYWLTCPLAGARIGRLESIGGVRRMEARAASDESFGKRLAEAHARYANERDRLLPDGAEPRPTGGIAGSSGGVKCLHAHYADRAAGNDNPIGEVVAAWIEPLDCAVPCVVGGKHNPAWQEPR